MELLQTMCYVLAQAIITTINSFKAEIFCHSSSRQTIWPVPGIRHKPECTLRQLELPRPLLSVLNVDISLLPIG